MMENTKKSRISFSLYKCLVAISVFLTIAIFEHVSDTRVSSVITLMPGKGMLARKHTQVTNQNKGTTSSFAHKSDKNRIIQILAYMPNHGMLKGDAMNANFSKCIYNNCRATVSRNTTGANAIFIQGSNPSKPLPVRENGRQIIIFASLETPLYLSYIKLNASWNTYYNWSMTYRRDSDVPYMYGYVYPKYVSKETVFEQLQTDSILENRAYKEYENEVYRNPTGIKIKNYVKIFSKKRIMAAWMVSHCGTASRREDYVEEMKEIIDIDIYGKCNKRYCPKGNFEGCEQNVITNTFFYLAFENSVCTDYITEKSFKWFPRDIVIVTRGARNYGNHLPKGTYIDADEFRNPTELAKYLKELSSNKKEYIKFLKRKDMYAVFKRSSMAQIAFCNLCRKLNDIEKYGKRFDMERSWTNDSCISRKQLKIKNRQWRPL